MNSAHRPGKLQGYIAISVFWLAIMGLVLFATHRPAARPIEIIPAPSATPAPTPGPLLVDVAGAVLVPGVHELPTGSVVADAIAAAGGAAPGADLDRINKAARLQDGDQVYVPRLDETTPVLASPAFRTPVSESTQAPAQLLDINTASAIELETIPGVGPVLAQGIVEGRPYGSIEDIQRVSGIGPATFEKIKAYIFVR